MASLVGSEIFELSSMLQPQNATSTYAFVYRRCALGKSKESQSNLGCFGMIWEALGEGSSGGSGSRMDIMENDLRNETL